MVIVQYMPDQVKLNIGSGGEVIEGYKSVDLYVDADIKDDICVMSSFNNDSVDEIRIYHILEHLKDSSVSLALSSIFRVLKHGGKLVIEVPDFIWVLQDFLNTEEKSRWGWKIQTIFGLQTNGGEYHRTGFSTERLRTLIINAGFANVEVVSIFSDKYNQYVIDATAIKL